MQATASRHAVGKIREESDALFVCEYSWRIAMNMASSLVPIEQIGVQGDCRYTGRLMGVKRYGYFE